jgi:hypothetical protein
MSSSDTDAISAWNNASAQLNRYFSIFIFLFGTIGNILNILVLSQRALRTNPCSLFFLTSSIANFIAIITGLTSRMLSGWTADLTNTIDWLCKLRAFVLFISRNMGSWLIMLATIDRWLSSCINVHRRQLSTLKNAQRGIIFTIIISILLYIPIIYCYQANLINAPLKCYGKTDLCRLSNDLIYASITIIFPMIFMIIFGLMTVVNIYRIKNRVNAINIMELTEPGSATNEQQQHSKPANRKLDHRLFVMLFIQILLLSLFTLPQAIQKLYSTLTSNLMETTLRKAVENFLFNLVLLLTYVANGMPFYIYTLSGGTVFRTALKSLLQNIIQKIL